MRLSRQKIKRIRGQKNQSQKKHRKGHRLRKAAKISPKNRNKNIRYASLKRRGGRRLKGGALGLPLTWDDLVARIPAGATEQGIDGLRSANPTTPANIVKTYDVLAQSQFKKLRSVVMGTDAGGKALRMYIRNGFPLVVNGRLLPLVNKASDMISSFTAGQTPQSMTSVLRTVCVLRFAIESALRDALHKLEALAAEGSDPARGVLRATVSALSTMIGKDLTAMQSFIDRQAKGRPALRAMCNQSWNDSNLKDMTIDAETKSILCQTPLMASTEYCRTGTPASPVAPPASPVAPPASPVAPPVSDVAGAIAQFHQLPDAPITLAGQVAKAKRAKSPRRVQFAASGPANPQAALNKRLFTQAVQEFQSDFVKANQLLNSINARVAAVKEEAGSEQEKQSKLAKLRQEVDTGAAQLNEKLSSIEGLARDLPSNPERAATIDGLKSTLAKHSSKAMQKISTAMASVPSAEPASATLPTTAAAAAPTGAVAKAPRGTRKALSRAPRTDKPPTGARTRKQPVRERLAGFFGRKSAAERQAEVTGALAGQSAAEAAETAAARAEGVTDDPRRAARLAAAEARARAGRSPSPADGPEAQWDSPQAAAARMAERRADMAKGMQQRAEGTEGEAARREKAKEPSGWATGFGLSTMFKGKKGEKGPKKAVAAAAAAQSEAKPTKAVTLTRDALSQLQKIEGELKTLTRDVQANTRTRESASTGKTSSALEGPDGGVHTSLSTSKEDDFNIITIKVRYPKEAQSVVTPEIGSSAGTALAGLSESISHGEGEVSVRVPTETAGVRTTEAASGAAEDDPSQAQEQAAETRLASEAHADLQEKLSELKSAGPSAEPSTSPIGVVANPLASAPRGTEDAWADEPPGGRTRSVVAGRESASSIIRRIISGDDPTPRIRLKICFSLSNDKKHRLSFRLLQQRVLYHALRDTATVSLQKHLKAVNRPPYCRVEHLIARVQMWKLLETR